MGGVTVTRTVCISATEGTNSEDEKLKRRRGNSKLCRQPQRGGRRADNGHVAAQWRQRFVWQTRRHERCIETCAMLFFRFFFSGFFFRTEGSPTNVAVTVCQCCQLVTTGSTAVFGVFGHPWMNQFPPSTSLDTRQVYQKSVQTLVHTHTSAWGPVVVLGGPLVNFLFVGWVSPLLCCGTRRGRGIYASAVAAS